MDAERDDRGFDRRLRGIMIDITEDLGAETSAKSWRSPARRAVENATAC